MGTDLLWKMAEENKSVPFFPYVGCGAYEIVDVDRDLPALDKGVEGVVGIANCL